MRGVRGHGCYQRVLQLDVWRGVARPCQRYHEPEHGGSQSNEIRGGSWTVGGREVSRAQSRRRDGQISGALIQPHHEAAPPRPCEVHFHDLRRRPRKALIDTEEHVRESNPGPRWRPHEQERDRNTKGPGDQEDAPSSDAIGEVAGKEIRDRLGKAKRDEKADRNRCRDNAEF